MALPALDLPPLDLEKKELPPLDLPPLDLSPLKESETPVFEEPKVEFTTAPAVSTAVPPEPPPRREIGEELPAQKGEILPTTDIRKIMGKGPEPEIPLIERLEKEQRKVLTEDEEKELLKQAEAEAIRKGQEIAKSGLTPKEFAEKEVLGKPEEDLGSRIANTWYRIKHGVGRIDPAVSVGSFFDMLGQQIQQKRPVSREETLAIQYEKAKAKALETKQERQYEQQAKYEAEYGPEKIGPTAEPSTTAAPAKEPELIPLATLEPPPPGIVKKASDLIVDTIDKYELNKGKGWDTLVRQLVGTLVGDAPELLLGEGALQLGAKALTLTKVGKKLEEVSQLEKLLKGMSKTDKILLRRKLGSTFAERAALEAGGLAGETGVFLTPEILKTGELPTGKQLSGTMLAVLGFRGGRKLLGKVGEAIEKRLPKEAPSAKPIPPVSKKPSKKVQPEGPTPPTSKAPEGVEGEAPTTQKVGPVKHKYVDQLKKAEVDELSEVANSNKIRKEMRRAVDEDKYVAAIDVDYFKRINDVISHDTGDQVLKALGRDLKENFNADIIGRQGGDEFSIVFNKKPTEAQLRKFYETFADRVTVEGQPVTLSIGIGKGKKGENLYANMLQEEAKKAGNQLIVDIDGKKLYIKGREIKAGERSYVERHGIQQAIREQERILKESKTLSSKDRRAIKRAIQTLRKEEQSVLEREAFGRIDAPDLEPTKLNRKAKPAKRQKGILSQVGAVGAKDQANIPAPQNKDASKFQNMMNWQRRKMQQFKKLTPGKVRDWVESRFLQHEAPIVRRIEKDPQGHRAIIRLQNARGASGAADIYAKEAKKSVYENVLHDEESIFESLLQAHRTIEVEKLFKVRKGKAKTQQEMDLYNEPPEIVSPGGLTSKEAQAYIEEVKTQFPEMYARHEQAMQKYWDTMANQVKELRKEGIIDKEFESFLLQNHKHYSPRLFLQHLDPEIIGVDLSGRRINVSDSGIKRLDKGSEGALISDARFLLDQTILRTQNRIFKNRANKELFKYLEQNPENPLGIKLELPKRIDKRGQPVFEAVPPGWTRVMAMEMGSPRAMLMPNEMAKHWMLRDPQISQELANVLQWVTGTKVLKAMATGVNPEFAVNNLPRDMVYTWFKQHKAFNPVLPIGMFQLGKEMAGVSKDVFLRKGLYRDYMTRGGSMDFLTQQGALFKRKLGEFKGTGSELMEQVGESLAYVGNTSEALPRIALMKRMMDKGYSMEEAVHIARTNLDFAQGGTYIKALDNAFPYLGAGVQGTRGIFQAFKTDPAIATFKAAQVMGLSAGLTYWGMKAFPKMYDMISPRERESGWIIPLGAFKFEDKETGQERYPYLKIPKDYGQRVFSSVGETIALTALGKSPDYQGLRMAFTDIMPVDALTQIPPTLSAYLSYMNNRDFWRKRDVWQGRKVSPQFEFYEDTPQFWVIAGEKTGLSPERLRTATGEIWPKNIYTDLMMMGWDQMKIDDKGEINRNIYEHLAKMPFSRRVLRLTWPDRKDDLILMKDIIRLREGGIEVPVWTEEKDEKGKPIPRSKIAVKKEVKEKELKLNDWRHVNDIKLKRLMIEEFSNPDISKENPKITEFFGKVGKEHPGEPDRLARRYAKEKAAQNRKRKKMKTWEALYFEVTGEETK